MQLKIGSTGEDVKKLQQRLNELGYKVNGAPLKVDGKFGPATEAAVNKFKEDNNILNDGPYRGVVGETTWKFLFPAKPNMRKLVYYSQEDPRWANKMYSITGDRKQTIATSGCGITCAAMVVSSITPNKVLPPESADYAVRNGFRTPNSGTSWAFFKNYLSRFGINVEQTGDFNKVVNALKNKQLVIASMGVGHFTQGGHYILLTNIKTINGVNWIEVFDPNQANSSYFKYKDNAIDEAEINGDGIVFAKDSVFKKEAKQYWICSV